MLSHFVHLLLFLLRRKPLAGEVDFHRDLVLNRYREYHTHLLFTGYHDRAWAKALKKDTKYSLQFLRKDDAATWRRIRRYRSQLRKLPKLVTRLAELPKLVQRP